MNAHRNTSRRELVTLFFSKSAQCYMQHLLLQSLPRLHEHTYTMYGWLLQPCGDTPRHPKLVHADQSALIYSTYIHRHYLLYVPIPDLYLDYLPSEAELG